MRRTLLLVVLALVAAAACSDDDPQPAATTATEQPSTTQPPTTTERPTTTTTSSEPPPSVLPIDGLETVVGDLEVPWEIAFVDERTFLVTERTGTVRVVQDGRVRPEPALVLDAMSRGEGGVLGLALHPDFPDERAAYVYYTTGSGNRVSRFTVGDDLALSGEEVLLDGIPAARNHDGGRIAFGPDGHLYVTTGDAAEPEQAADLGSLAGKILRVTADGAVPRDNPFDGSPVWSYGHRNPQGLAWTAGGDLYATEHGPSGDLGLRAHDEVNRIEPGAFYGWPFVAGTTPTGQGDPPAEPVPPVASSGDATWAPSGVAVVTGPDGADVLLFAGLRGEGLFRLALDGASTPERIVDGLGRLRIVAVGPDGCLHVGTSNTDGRGDPAPDDDRILRTC